MIIWVILTTNTKGTWSNHNIYEKASIIKYKMDWDNLIPTLYIILGLMEKNRPSLLYEWFKNIKIVA